MATSMNRDTADEKVMNSATPVPPISLLFLAMSVLSQLTVFSICSSGLFSALLVLSTIYISF